MLSANFVSVQISRIQIPADEYLFNWIPSFGFPCLNQSYGQVVCSYQIYPVNELHLITYFYSYTSDDSLIYTSAPYQFT